MQQTVATDGWCTYRMHPSPAGGYSRILCPLQLLSIECATTAGIESPKYTTLVSQDSPLA
jgi:hypothetical protein